MRTIRRLRLRCFSFNIFSDELSTYRLVTLSNLGQAHQKLSCHICSISVSIGGVGVSKAQKLILAQAIPKI
jgi:hypothetical protein